MINYNNHNITKKIVYNNHNIKYVYGCNGNLVWSGDTPTPIYRWVQTDVTTCVEVVDPIYRWTQTDVTTCVEEN